MTLMEILLVGLHNMKRKLKLGTIAYNPDNKTKCVFVGVHPTMKNKSVWLVVCEDYMYNKHKDKYVPEKELESARVYDNKILKYDEDAILSINERIHSLEDKCSSLRLEISKSFDKKEAIFANEKGIERLNKILLYIEGISYSLDNYVLGTKWLEDGVSILKGNEETIYSIPEGVSKSFVDKERTTIIKSIHSLQKGIRTMESRERRHKQDIKILECDLQRTEILILYNKLLIEEIKKQMNEKEGI